MRMRIFLLLPAVVLFASNLEGQEVTSFQYDALGRLTDVRRLGCLTTTRAGYRLDAAGNRTNVTTNAGSSSVPNCSFEYPQLATYAYTPSEQDTDGFKFYGASGIARHGSAWGFPAAWQGSQVAFLQGGGGGGGWFNRTITGLVVGQTYRVAFAAAQRPGFPVNQVTVKVGDVVVWAGAPASATEFTAYASAPFVAQASEVIITFAAEPTVADTGSAVDVISIESV